MICLVLRRQRTIRTAFAMAAVGALAGGCQHCAAPAAPAMPPAKVFVATPIVRQIVEWDEDVERLAAVDSVEVRARVSGNLESIHFNEGELVQENQLLFIVDPRPYQAELNQAKADLNEARAGVTQAAATLTQVQAQRREAVAHLELARLRAERARVRGCRESQCRLLFLINNRWMHRSCFV